jgi:hypothetical protein
MNTLKINDIEYVNSEDFFIKAPIYCKDSRNGRELIKKNKITDYIFAKLESDKWILSDGKSRKYDKLFLTKTFVDTIPEINEEKIIINDGIESAPDIINLEDGEKFKDIDGNIVKIETRGERKVDKIYFKVKDVMLGFEMENLNKVIINNNTNYIENEHYKYFNCKKEKRFDKKTNKTIKKELFLTYDGILRILFASYSSKAKSFVKWATETLFTLQLGTEKQKEILASNLLGVNAQTIKDVFKTNNAKTPCVYLYLIGNANKLLEGNYNDNDLLCKYGCTDDLERRCGEHDKKFMKEFNSKIELLCFSIIEAKYIFNAETNITQYFKSNIIEYKNTKELIVINKKDLNSIKTHYGMIQHSYIGRYEEMYNKISLLEKEIIEFNNKFILQNEKHKNELKDKNFEIKNEQHKNELKDKDIELLQYKIKFLELQNK